MSNFKAHWRPWTWAIALLACGLLMLVVSAIRLSLPLAAAATAMAAGGLLARPGRRSSGWKWLLAWTPLWLIVPLAMLGEPRLSSRLEWLTARLASMTLDVLEVQHVPQGRVLELPGQRILVDQACRGLNSPWGLVFATVLLVAAGRRPWLWSAALLASSLAWSWLASTARVVTEALAQAWYQIDWSSGWREELLGVAALALALLLLAAADRWLAFFLWPILPPDQDLACPVEPEDPHEPGEEEPDDGHPVVLPEPIPPGVLIRGWNALVGGGRWTRDPTPASQPAAVYLADAAQAERQR